MRLLTFQISRDAISRIMRIKGKRGFTLVELIVVLVILAVLTALLVPALTGYIDMAKRTPRLLQKHGC